MSDPPYGFKAVYHHPLLYRYRVASPGFRLARNYYASQGHTAWIGLALVAGRYAYCVKWADAKVLLP